MVLKHLALLAVGSLAVSPLVSAQQQGTGPAKATQPVKIQEAAQHREFSFPVVGLTRDNLQRAEKAVAGIQLAQYCCECGFAQDMAGKCPECDTALSETQVLVLAGPMLSVDKKALTFQLNEGVHLGLAQLDAALRADSIHVDREALEIAGPARIVFANVTSKEGATALENTLKEGKLLPNAKVTFMEDSKEARVQVERSTAPFKLPALTALARKSGASWTVSDVMWTSGRKPKGKTN